MGKFCLSTTLILTVQQQTRTHTHIHTRINTHTHVQPHLLRPVDPVVGSQSTAPALPAALRTVAAPQQTAPPADPPAAAVPKQTAPPADPPATAVEQTAPPAVLPAAAVEQTAPQTAQPTSPAALSGASGSADVPAAIPGDPEQPDLQVMVSVEANPAEALPQWGAHGSLKPVAHKRLELPADTRPDITDKAAKTAARAAKAAAKAASR